MWESHYHQGQEHLAQKQPELAILHFQSALAEVENETLHTALIESYISAHAYDDALSHLQTLTKENPTSALYAGLLGDVYMAQESYLQALHIYTQALNQNPRHVILLGKSAEAAAKTYDLDLAVVQYKKALKFSPKDIDTRLGLADIYDQQKKHALAAELYEALYQENPERTDILVQWFQSQTVEDPGQAIYLVIELAKRYPTLKGSLAIHAASLLRSAGEVQEAKKSLEVALADPLLLDKEAYSHLHQLLYDYMPANAAQVQNYAQQLRQWAKNLQPAEQALIDSDYENLNPYLNLWSVLAFHPYLNINPHDSRKAFGIYFQSVIPLRPFVPPTLKTQSITFVLNGNSPVYQFMRGMLLNWPENWQVTLAYTAVNNSRYPISEFLKLHRPDFNTLFLSEEPSEALTQLENLNTGILFFTEIHTDQVLQSFLAAHRIAPVQITSWLSSGTTGLSTIDYFLSAEVLEQKNAQAFYTEKLIKLPEIPTFIYAPTHPTLQQEAPPRADYGMPETGNIYLCPHLMYKLHPDYDNVLGEILENDPEGILVLLARPALPIIQNQLLKRFETLFPHLMKRIWFMPLMEPEDLWGLMRLADVMLDPFYFGGGTTSYEALSFGVPIITWPGERLHGRITYAYYQKMGVLEAVAMSPEDYAQKAVYFAKQKDKQAELRGRILENKHLLFEQTHAITTLASQLEQML